MSILHKSVRLARVLYRQSLRLLPRRFYAEYAEQMALDFDDQLDELMEYLPEDAEDKVGYIRHDEVWHAVCEMADWTLARIVQMSMPEEPFWSPS